MSDWASMMNAMDDIDSGRSTQKHYNIPRGGDDISQLSSADMAPKTATQMEMENAKIAKANAEYDPILEDEKKYAHLHQQPQQQVQQVQNTTKMHKGSYECANMYAKMLQEQEDAKAVAQGYTQPKRNTAPQPMMESTQPVRKIGGSLVDQIKQLNSEGGQSQRNGILQENNYQAFIRQDYNRKRGAIKHISEKLNSLDINTCEPDEILQGMSKVIKSLYGE
jgi:hypothetical protein